jgi:hypothetical protein
MLAHKIKVEEHEKVVRDKYGKIPIAEWDALRNKTPEEPENTLREDYEIGIIGEEFDCTYRASCECGFSFEYAFSKRVDLKSKG